MNPTERFSDRVRDYVLYRPAYPPSALAVLRDRCGLKSGAAVADIGSGTGILTKSLLEAGATVFGVEPNEPMRRAAEEMLRNSPGFRSCDGTAEKTGLPDHCVDLVTAAQAFHWFDIPAARREAIRILRDGGKAALLWNERIAAGDAFHEDYEALIVRHAGDYQRVDHRKVGADAFDRFFGPGGWTETCVPNEQSLDQAGLRGRLLSSSYVPAVGKPGYDRMMNELNDLFARFERGGRVALRYEVKIVHGRLA